MNAGQHLGNTKQIIENIDWLQIMPDNPNKIMYFQIMNWIPDYVSLIDIVGKFKFLGIIDYIPFIFPFLGKPSFSFFKMDELLSNLSSNTICTMDEKIFHKFHFDSLNSLKAIEDHWNWFINISENWIKDIKNEPEKNIQYHKLISLFAETLHAVQDFYSHSNWIEYLHEKYNFTTKEEFPTWFDVFFDNNPSFNDVRSHLKSKDFVNTNILTGYFATKREKPLYDIFHNDKKNKPGLNKDRAERPYFDVVYHLAIKNGIQWLEFIKMKFLDLDLLELLKIDMTDQTIDWVNQIHPYIKKISFKVREWNGQNPFKDIDIEIPEIYLKNSQIEFYLKQVTSEKLVKYDRDFRKTFVKIKVKDSGKVIKEFKVFGKKSGLSKFKIKLSDLPYQVSRKSLSVRVDFGLYHIEKMIIKQY